MSLKREVSQSVAELRNTVKRLALDESDTRDNINFLASHQSQSSQESDCRVDPRASPHPMNSIDTMEVSSIEEETQTEPKDSSSTDGIKTILSTSRNNFEECYIKLEEIGRGGFSVVYKCRSLMTNEVFAVKVIDLRPLKLHQRFNPSRLRREVDIMRRLRHPSVIQFVEVFETEDQLMVVMEFAPGDELFDVILARQFFSEEDAKPIFQQIASSLSYLHSLDIIHRDIKPENILFLHQKHPITGLPMIKLLDFGLSKHAGMGSEAKTFVGTPCYLAPEVELTAKGQGGTYGAPADCWSMGAVLYVMLVARFPEFHRHENGKLELKLPGPLWANKSQEARDIVKGLMSYDPKTRLTAAQAMSHPWLGKFASQYLPPPTPPATTPPAPPRS